MTSLLSSSFENTASGNYQIDIKIIFHEAWQRLKGIKKVFWAGFLLFFLIMLGVTNVVGFLMSFLHVFNWMKPWIEVLVLPFSISMIFLTLRYLRNPTINAMIVFEFRKAWQAFVLISIIFYFINVIFFTGSDFIFYKLNEGLNNSGLGGLLFLAGLNGSLVIALPYLYIIMGIVMAMLLVLDKKIPLLQGLKLAFKSINRRLFKNLVLDALAWLMVLTIIFLFNLGMVLFWVVGMVAIWIGLVLLTSLIVLLPMVSLVTAIQYRQIFCDEGPL